MRFYHFFLIVLFPILSVLGQQCVNDVVVTSPAALKNDLRALLSNLDVHVNGNISCSETCNGIKRKIKILETELNEMNKTLNARLDSMLHNITEQLGSENLLHKLNELFNVMLDNMTEQVSSLQAQLSHIHLYGRTSIHPATSCADILHTSPDSPSGYYWIEAVPGQSGKQFCDMTRTCGGVAGGWMRIAELDMTNSSHQCPRGLRQRTYSNKRTCVRDSDSGGCSSVTFPNAALSYSKVCGKIIAYQFGTVDSFDSSENINGHYMDGISLTLGNPRRHLWSFAAALDQLGSNPSSNCPCTNSNLASRAISPPAFVGRDYFCDTAPDRYQYIFYGANPLWDGGGCGPLNTCCSFNNPPWFYKQLPQPTTDDIEMRTCRDEDVRNEDIAIETVEIYVQ